MFGVYVIIFMLCWIELKLCVCDYFGIKIEFWFGDVNEI